MRCLCSNDTRLFESVACSAAAFLATCDLCLWGTLPQPRLLLVMLSQSRAALSLSIKLSSVKYRVSASVENRSSRMRDFCFCVSSFWRRRKKSYASMNLGCYHVNA